MNQNRRKFITTTTTSAAGFAIIGCQKTAKAEAPQSSGVFIGEGAHKYEVFHDWVSLPDKFTWQTTHNVALDSGGNLYVIHEGRENETEHPAIFVFDPGGKFIRAFGKQFQGGGHGLEVRKEGKNEYLYVTGYQKLKTFAKLTLTGEEVWSQKAPLASGAYPEDENSRTDFSDRKNVWGRNHFLPTNFAFLDDGGFFVADGYGSYKIHRYDKDAKYVSSFGTEGKDDGQFRTSHGLWIDSRGPEKQVVIADRANGRLQWFSLEGEHRKTLTGFDLPANIDQLGDLLLVPELKARITLLDKDNNLIRLGEDPEWTKAVLADGKAMRKGPATKWAPGKFIHPHDACFAPNGDIYVAEWVASGRITKLKLVS